MVIVRLQGGLGNQMFQYAAGRRLAHALNSGLKLDVNGFNGDNLRTYKLHHFAIQEHFASLDEIACIDNHHYGGRLAFLAKARLIIPPFKRLHVFEEATVTPLRREVLNAKGDIYLKGYWQSEKYFAGTEKIIRREFSIKSSPDSINKEIAEQISSTNSVSLHVRRGDYITNPQVNRVHGTCDLKYYYDCIGELVKRVREPHFFVFSDDPEWITEHLDTSYPTSYLTFNKEEKDFEDLGLMSLCKHHIIANSSFSWWGAWLSNNPDKLVFAPKKWFNDTKIDTRDLIPDSWISV